MLRLLIFPYCGMLLYNFDLKEFPKSFLCPKVRDAWYTGRPFLHQLNRRPGRLTIKY